MNLHFIEDFYDTFKISISIQATFSIAIIFLVAFLFTRLTKLIKLPNVSAYLLTGVLIGPFVLNLIPSGIITDMEFITDCGLGIIGFSCGRFFDLKMIKENGLKPVIISLVDTFFTAIVLFFAMWLCKLPLPAALIIGCIGASTSAGSTVITIKQYDCKGNFVDYMIEVIALNNVFILLAFSVCIGISGNLLNTSASSISAWETIGLPIVTNLAMIIVGGLSGLLLAKILIIPTRTKDNRLILTVATLLLLVGICGLSSIFGSSVSVSPLLCAMVMAGVYRNLTKDSTLFSQVDTFCAPLLLIFFVRSGLNLQVDSIASIGLAGLIYFVLRSLTKYGGVALGGLITRSDNQIVKYGGFLLYPAASVAIGLASIAGRFLTNLGQVEMANSVTTIAIATSVLFEIIGPALVKMSLKKSGALVESSKGSKKKIMVVETGSMLHDAIELPPTPEMIERQKALNATKEALEQANRYIHTKEYTKNDYSHE